MRSIISERQKSFAWALVEPVAYGVASLFGAAASTIALPVLNECMRRTGEFSAHPDKVIHLGIPHILQTVVQASDIDCSNHTQMMVRTGAIVLATAASLFAAVATSLNVGRCAYVNQVAAGFGQVICELKTATTWTELQPTAAKLAGVLVDRARSASTEYARLYNTSSEDARRVMRDALNHSTAKNLRDPYAMLVLCAAVQKIDEGFVTTPVRDILMRCGAVSAKAL